MIFHPNPMIELRKDYWQDKHLKIVVVKPILVNNSKNPTRYVVYKMTSKETLVTQSKHITMEQAIVSAQTLANRLYRRSVNKTKKPSISRISKVTVIQEERKRMMDLFSSAMDEMLAGNTYQAKLKSLEVQAFINRNL